MAANGGIIGPVNTISAGRGKITSKTASGAGTITTQAGTRTIQTLILAGGGGGGSASGGSAGGGGAGGYRCIEANVSGSAPYSLSIGAGGAQDATGTNTTLTIGCTTYTST